MAQEIDTNEQSANKQSRCEIDKVRKAEGECLRPGEVQLDGHVLCVSHAELLRLDEHSETRLGEVFKMDQWLESADDQADELGKMVYAIARQGTWLKAEPGWKKNEEGKSRRAIHLCFRNGVDGVVGVDHEAD